MAMPQTDEIHWLIARSLRSPGRARALLREQAAEWGIGARAAEAAELLLSELVTNAVRHARAPQGRDLGIRLARYDGLLRVEVADAGPAVKLTPQVRAGPGARDRRGPGRAVGAVPPAPRHRQGGLGRGQGVGTGFTTGGFASGLFSQPRASVTRRVMR
ncbi:ATP-binding protein [Streptomyces sp. NPDC002104]